MNKSNRIITKSNNKRDNGKLGVLRLLIENPEKDYSIRKIALERKINYRSAYEIVKKLEKEGVIDVKKYGNVSVVKFNNNFNESVFIAENQRKEDFLKNKDFKVLYRRVREIKNPFFICVVFGSYAKGTARKGSDLDLWIKIDKDLSDLDLAKINKELSKRMEVSVEVLVATPERMEHLRKNVESLYYSLFNSITIWGESL